MHRVTAVHRKGMKQPCTAEESCVHGLPKLNYEVPSPIEKPRPKVNEEIPPWVQAEVHWRQQRTNALNQQISVPHN